MSGHVFTPAENGNPQLVAEVVANLAKLKPTCLRCGRVLPARELAKGRTCSSREDCTLRRIFGGQRVPDGQGLKLAEVHALQKHCRSRVPFVSTWEPFAAATEEESFPGIAEEDADEYEQEIALEESDGLETEPEATYSSGRPAESQERAADAEWRPFNPYVWRPAS